MPYNDLIDEKYSNLASVFISNDATSFLFHFDPGGKGGNSFDLIIFDSLDDKYEVLAIRDISESMPMVDSIVKKKVHVHYNFENEKKVFPDTLDISSVILGHEEKLKHNYIFFNQSHYCGSHLYKKIYFDSAVIRMPKIVLYLNSKVADIQDLNKIQFPYKKNCIEYLTINDCTEEYTILEPEGNLQVDVIKKEILKTLLKFSKQ